MISILLSVRNNYGGLLEKTLGSIHRQTYENWELIAIDDGSSDNTLKILNNFLKQNPCFMQIISNKENIGLTKSLVLAESIARGQYLARIDSGDEFLPDKLQKQIDFIESENGLGIVGCNYINKYSPGDNAKPCIMPEKDSEIRKTILKRNPFAHSCIIMRRDVYQKAGGYDPAISFGQDYDLWFRILKISKAANLQEFLCLRTIDEQSVSYLKQREQMQQCLKTQWKYMNRWNPILYVWLIEPMAMAVLPTAIKRFIRKLLF